MIFLLFMIYFLNIIQIEGFLYQVNYGTEIMCVIMLV